MMFTQRLRYFLRYYWFRLNNGMPPGTRPFTPEEINVLGLAASARREGWKINLFLFLVTLSTTTLAGADYSGSWFDIMKSGIVYSIPLMSILAIHEFGHYFAARRFGVRATLPFFIPFPSIVGTMGAVIKTRSPIPHNRALLYIGMMGPLPGFIASLAAVIVGVSLSAAQSVPVGDGMSLMFGDSLLIKFIVYIIHGPLPEGSDIYLHPVAWAGWIGFLVTNLNLMPIGQLDGGHVLRALIGRRQLYAGWFAFAALLLLSAMWPGWIVWVILTLVILMVAHPEVPETERLSIKERAAGWSCMLIFVLTFMPVPVQVY